MRLDSDTQGQLEKRGADKMNQSGPDKQCGEQKYKDRACVFVLLSFKRNIK